MNSEIMVVIIGGGVTGAGILWDLSLRGIKCTLIEKEDLCNGASGRNHGLLHSGGRYAVEDPESADECARENKILRQLAPWAIEPCGGLFIRLAGDSPEYTERWLAGCKAAQVATEPVALAAAYTYCPYLSDDVAEAYLVQDAAIDVYKLVRGLVIASRSLGANVMTRTEVIGFIFRGGRITGVRVRNTSSGFEEVIGCSLVINAAGAWAGKVAQMAGCRVKVAPDRGILLVFNARLASCVINRLRIPGDGDILVPSHNVSIFGTTSGITDTIDDQMVKRQEVEYLLAAGSELIPGMRDFRRLRAYAGVRPLLGSDDIADSRNITRTFKVFDHKEGDGVDGFISAVGGKFTTYRLMAEKTANLAAAKLGCNKPSFTGSTPIPAPEGTQQANASKSFYIFRKDSRREDRVRQLICDCEGVTDREILVAAISLPWLTLNELRNRSRFGMGTCQGTFCTYRVLGLLIEAGLIQSSEALGLLMDFLKERWKGALPVGSGEQLRETEFAHALYAYTMGLEFASGRMKGKEFTDATRPGL
ncbi:anaerobic glycerol-3-phosphate dehydrogenase subunit A [Moorella thermoacetica]|uniref:glycerol-3-phosphate dehydrogenase n=1 Tax=Neomoorella thermoacetica TaxID=1525 RepID=A0A1J5JG25_NEOTH|nr:anaerobic glycerol-3-phosphate dehydrogenase subunit GlpA [Moorella thermoacetica]OIQ08149.1 anaerobic glycerol-3-phosphate dehydrogenase subunit A [Moorella thermoacetica]